MHFLEQEGENGIIDRDAEARLAAVLNALLSLWGDLTFVHRQSDRAKLYLSDTVVLVLKAAAKLTRNRCVCVCVCVCGSCSGCVDVVMSAWSVVLRNAVCVGLVMGEWMCGCVHVWSVCVGSWNGCRFGLALG